ncbi:endolytic transglycosylase MltG [Mesoterricola sediminis]|uniref:Endolytic murein transglycosylase n=1 Tax=Mesoterricola sediminis TaxID=2927980 RepID=A0AA48H1S4_9BACT|nr:endolytic transglycosylase MltG [Mesoterricola sediminis]BDU75901.1 aminodeoxychorismate lyase [Mesoterricola sediminis]
MAKSRTSLRLAAATLLLALIPLSGLWMWKGRGPLTAQATLLVKRGATVDALADQMEREGLIRNAALFKLWARARKLQLIRGEYTLEPGASLSDVANKLKRADIHYTNLVVPVGAHAWMLQARLKSFMPEDVFWTLWKSPRLAKTAGFPDAESLEGLVAPATYKLHHAMEPEEILLTLVEAFRDKVLPSLDGGALPPYETLILASLAEKETRVPTELPKVAGVYAQRLRIGMRLQCDPTTLYARWLSGDLRYTAPTAEDLHRTSRFNTYTRAGLPPTPIAVPSPAAIEAAKVPSLGKDLFFVATGKGGHAFAPSLSEHNRNVGAYRREIRRQKKALAHG